MLELFEKSSPYYMSGLVPFFKYFKSCELAFPFSAYFSLTKRRFALLRTYSSVRKRLPKSFRKLRCFVSPSTFGVQNFPKRKALIHLVPKLLLKMGRFLFHDSDSFYDIHINMLVSHYSVQIYISLE